MMDRLTIRNSDGSVSQPLDLKWAEALERLADYEDAEEAGLLVKLPCKVGDKVYFIEREFEYKNKAWRKFVREGYIKAIKFSSRPTKLTVEYEDLHSRGGFKGADYHASNIGKTLFLTREEAEAALAKMKAE